MIVDLLFKCDQELCSKFGDSEYIKGFTHDIPEYARCNQKYLIYRFNLVAAQKVGGFKTGDLLEMAGSPYINVSGPKDAFIDGDWAWPRPSWASKKRSKGIRRSLQQFQVEVGMEMVGMMIWMMIWMMR